jgi:hypothetical protein
MKLTPTTIAEIESQCKKEISFAQQHKNGKIGNWQKNEDLYYNKKVPSTESRANVNLGGGQEFVHTLLSKIKTPLVFKYTKTKESQLQRIARANSLRERDFKKGHWSIKDAATKKQCLIYGRAVSFYYADSPDGVYRSHNEPCDVYDFLIDPAAGGIDTDAAKYLGGYGVNKTRQELEAAIKDKKSTYIKSQVQNLLNGTGNSTAETKEEIDKKNRTGQLSSDTQKEIQSEDKFKFWRWFTTYKGERVYVLYDNESGTAIDIDLLENRFSTPKDMDFPMWPVWTWAAYPDLTEFWTPAPLDYVREIIYAQNTSINQALDNAEAINKPQKAICVDEIENLAQLKYKRNGDIYIRKGVDINKAVQLLATVPINTPVAVFELLERIKAGASGVTNDSKGVADEDGKVAIYEGNKEEAADRYGLIYDSYADAVARWAALYEIGIMDHLTKKVAIEILGPNGIEVEMVNRNDIKKKSDEFGILVDAANSEKLLSASQQRAKMTFLTQNSQSPNINQKKSIEIQAKIVGFDEDTINELLDVDEYGNSELMAECARDIESLAEGKDIKPNDAANNAYRQKMLDYMKNNKENMNSKIWAMFENYMIGLSDVVVKNEARAITAFNNKQVNNAANLGSGLGGAAINNNPTAQNQNEQGQTGEPIL